MAVDDATRNEMVRDHIFTHMDDAADTQERSANAVRMSVQFNKTIDEIFEIFYSTGATALTTEKRECSEETLEKRGAHRSGD